MPLQELWRGTQAVKELLEPLGDYVPVGVGHVEPVLGPLQQGGEEGLGEGLVEHLHGRGQRGVGVLRGSGLVWVPGEKMPMGGLLLGSLVCFEKFLSITGGA